MQRRGYCPRVWSPMASGDGLIVRVRPGLAPIEVGKLAQLIALAERHGNGQIEVTRRANLQLRGVREGELRTLQEGLVASGWATATPAEERGFALLASPWLALDPANARLLELARVLEGALSSDAAPALLHAKLCIAIDDGRRSLDALPADLWLVPSARQPGRVLLAVADHARTRHLLGSCALDEAPQRVLALLNLLAEGGAAQRVHAWLAGSSLARLRAALGVTREDDERVDLAPARAPSLLGHHAGSRSWYGLALAFGSGSSNEWRSVAELAARFGSGTIALSPRRELLLLDVADNERSDLERGARTAGLIHRPDDPLHQVIACTGAPGCGAAHGETRALARTLSESARPLLARGALLHVSGCAKGCAHSGASALTLVYDRDGLHLARDASASDAVSAALVSHDEAEDALRAFAREYATPAIPG